MALDPDFLDMMPHTISVEIPTGGYETDGREKFAAPVDFRCRIVGKGISLRSAGKDELSMIYTVYVDSGDTLIPTNSRVTLPAAFQHGEKPVIFTSSRLTDDSESPAIHHTVLLLGWMYHRQGMN